MCTAIMGLVALLLVLSNKLFGTRKPQATGACPFDFLKRKRAASAQQLASASGLHWQESFIDGTASSEAAFVNQAVIDINDIQEKNKARGKASNYERAFHAKIQAGVKNAVLRVSTDLPQHLRVGFLQPSHEYVATVRFSNASGVIQPDTVKDLRGIAVRIATTGGAHDFLATNGKVSHARDARQFIQFAKAGAGPRFLMLPKLVFSVGIAETWRMLATVIGQTKCQITSLCSETYWSRAPYSVGLRAAKFQFTPNASVSANIPHNDGYLRDDLVARLKKGAVVFDLQVQFYLNEENTPIEDGAVEWKTPLITVAQLIIPQQDLTQADAVAAQSEVEKLEFNPWNTTPEFRPLGSLNRARRLVYQASQRLRKSK